MPTVSLTEAQAAYIAGLVDGEGSFGMSPLLRKQINVSVAISNTDRRLLDFCQRATGLGNVILQKGFRGPNHRVQYIWSIGARNELRAILPLLIPFLVGKAEQARVLLGYCERRARGGPQEQQDFDDATRIKALNARDKPKAA